MTGENLLYDIGNQKPVFCDNLEKWDGEGGSRRTELMYTFVDIWQKSSQYCNNLLIKS